MNSLSEIIESRYSCRQFQDKPIEKETLTRILSVARLAPSAVNYQPWEIMVISQPENLDKIYQVYPREWFKKAKTILLISANYETGWKRADGKNHADIDIAILTDHITLLATEMGLGTCWVCNFDAALTSKLFEFPEHLKPLVLLPIGYPLNNEKPVKKRKDLTDFVTWK